jgi:hypothetical protein
MTDRPAPDDSPLGVGAQVFVVEDAHVGPEGWVGDPTGVIVARGSAVAYGAIDSSGLMGRTWLVAFDEPQYRADGRGPYERAEVSERLLVAAPGIPEREL